MARLGVIVLPFLAIGLLAVIGWAVKQIIDTIIFLSWFLKDK